MSIFGLNRTIVASSFKTPDGGKAALLSVLDREDFVDKEQAPALALAILEAAGYEADTAGGQVNDAAYLLRAAIHQQAEDKERKALDAEAKELYEAFHEGGPFAPWEELDPRGVQRFRQATTRARKLHAAKEAAK